MVKLGVAVALVALVSCQGSEDSQLSDSGATYRVPVESALEPAAEFALREASWKVVEGTAELEYDLPLGLVGGLLKVNLEGPFNAATGTAELSGPVGTGSCSVVGDIVSCVEHFTGLGPLPLSMDEVERIAMLEYDGPVQDRIDVASIFAIDPIGIAELDLAALPTNDD